MKIATAPQNCIICNNNATYTILSHESKQQVSCCFKHIEDTIKFLEEIRPPEPLLKFRSFSA